jgi:hypothetical protein
MRSLYRKFAFLQYVKLLAGKFMKLIKMLSLSSYGILFKWGFFQPVPVAVRYKAWVCGRSLDGVEGSNPAEVRDICLLCVLCVVVVEVSATG